MHSQSLPKIPGWLIFSVKTILSAIVTGIAVFGFLLQHVETSSSAANREMLLDQKIKHTEEKVLIYRDQLNRIENKVDQLLMQLRH